MIRKMNIDCKGVTMRRLLELRDMLGLTKYVVR